jgi:nucleotide-binding universal stress UspA family protein
MDDMQPTIVVGVSGSRAAAAALHWAADEARRRRAWLRAVRTWDPAAHPAPYAIAEGLVTSQQRRAAASSELRAALHVEFGGQIPEYVAAELAEGVPERILRQRSAGADLLVLGAPTLSAGAGNPVGPVVRSCLSRSMCPVVVVSPAADPSALPQADDPALLSRPHPSHPAFGPPGQPRSRQAAHPALPIPAPRAGA